MSADTTPTETVTLDCPFCEYAGPSEILHDWGDAFVIEPTNPVVPGHVLVIPKAHVGSFTPSPPTTAMVMQRAAEYACVEIPGPCNLITSAGAAATQTVKHLHVHLVPRREGDELALPWSPRAALDGEVPGPEDRALRQINVIRNSIIGRQTLNWSLHIYPLVQALNEAGYEGMDIDEARERFSTDEPRRRTRYGYHFGYEAEREALEDEGLFCGSVGSKDRPSSETPRGEG